MDRLLSPDTFEFLARYFVAGWVFLSVRSWWVRGERPKPNEVIFEAIALSLLNQLLALGTLPLLLFAFASIQSTPLLIFEVLLQPVIIGLLIGWSADRDWMPIGIRRLVMPSVKPVSHAFDFTIDKLGGPAYFVLSFSDDRIVYGYFGKESFANGESGAKDIYLEKLFSLKDDGNWEDTGRAAWINLTGIRSIEIIPEEEIPNG